MRNFDENFCLPFVEVERALAFHLKIQALQ
jgi:hypothetical protein